MPGKQKYICPFGAEYFCLSASSLDTLTLLGTPPLGTPAFQQPTPRYELTRGIAQGSALVSLWLCGEIIDKILIVRKFIYAL